MVSTINSFVDSLKGSPLSPEGDAMRVFSGSPHPFGATVEDEGVNFAVYSANATAVQLLIFTNPTDPDPVKVIDLSPIDNKSFYIWHIYIEGLTAGSGYAYRVDGPNEPWNGHRFNPQKVLVDPYSKGNSLALWERGAACGNDDNLHKSMRSVVIDTRGYDWEGDRPLRSTDVRNDHLRNACGWLYKKSQQWRSTSRYVQRVNRENPLFKGIRHYSR
jgi:glycogen operon protein